MEIKQTLRDIRSRIKPENKVWVKNEIERQKSSSYTTLVAAIAYYLPYKPRVKSLYWKREGYMTYLSMTDQIELDFGDKFYMYDAPESLRLKLKPLDLYKDINSKAYHEINCDISHQIEIEELAIKHRNYTSLSVGAFELCLKNHIDIFDLIPQKLAIAI